MSKHYDSKEREVHPRIQKSRCQRIQNYPGSHNSTGNNSQIQEIYEMLYARICRQTRRLKNTTHLKFSIRNVLNFSRFDCNRVYGIQRYSLVEETIIHNQQEILEMLLSEFHADLNRSNDDGHTSIFIAVLYGQVDMIKFILRQEEVRHQLHRVDKKGYSCLDYARKHGFYEHFVNLLDYNPNEIAPTSSSEHSQQQEPNEWLDIVRFLNKKYRVSDTKCFRNKLRNLRQAVSRREFHAYLKMSLKIAAIYGQYEILRFLHTRFHISLNETFEGGNTILIVAMMNSEWDCVRWLLAQGVDMHHLNDDELSAEDFAPMNSDILDDIRNPKKFESIAKHQFIEDYFSEDFKTQEEPWRELFDAVRRNDLVFIMKCHERLLKRVLNQKCDGKSLLYTAVVCKNIAIADFLLNNGASVNTLNGQNQETALHAAVRINKTHVRHKMIDLLLQYNANPSIANRIGELPIHLASQNQTTRHLLEKVSNNDRPRVQRLHCDALTFRFQKPEVISELNIELLTKNGIDIFAWMDTPDEKQRELVLRDLRSALDDNLQLGRQRILALERLVNSSRQKWDEALFWCYTSESHPRLYKSVNADLSCQNSRILFPNFVVALTFALGRRGKPYRGKVYRRVELTREQFLMYQYQSEHREDVPIKLPSFLSTSSVDSEILRRHGNAKFIILPFDERNERNVCIPVNGFQIEECSEFEEEKEVLFVHGTRAFVRSARVVKDGYEIELQVTSRVGKHASKSDEELVNCFDLLRLMIFVELGLLDL